MSRNLPSWMKRTSAESAETPLLSFPGKIIYCFNTAECGLLCAELFSLLDERGELVIGFDCEWQVNFTTGSGKVALIQICPLLQSLPPVCYVFHVAAMQQKHLPNPLKSLLLDKRILKVGVNINGDFWKLDRDFDLRSTDIVDVSTLDLSGLANEVLRSAQSWSLHGLCKHLLGRGLDKCDEVRLKKWETYPLPQKQLNYAVLDAYASVRVYEELMKSKTSNS